MIKALKVALWVVPEDLQSIDDSQKQYSVGKFEQSIEEEGPRDVWIDLATIPSASPKVWMDACLAALAIRASLPLVTFDTDFRRFEPAGPDFQLLKD